MAKEEAIVINSLQTGERRVGHHVYVTAQVHSFIHSIELLLPIRHTRRN